MTAIGVHSSTAFGTVPSTALGIVPMTAESTAHLPVPSTRRTSRPTVSVVVAITDVQCLAEPGLASIMAGCAQVAVEVVVAHADVVRRVSQLNSRYPGMRFVSGGRTAAHAELRSVGLRHAGGDIVIFVEDRTLANTTSVEELIRGVIFAARKPSTDS